MLLAAWKLWTPSQWVRLSATIRSHEYLPGSDFTSQCAIAQFSALKFIIRLVFINRAGLGRIACDQAETFDPQRRGAKLGMRREIFLELMAARVAQPGQRHMRRKFTRFGRQAGADQRLLDLAL